jgi:hypothetical protein
VEDVPITEADAQAGQFDNRIHRFYCVLLRVLL